MTITSSRWVLWVALMILLPMPFMVGAELAPLPVARLLQLLCYQLLSDSDWLTTALLLQGLAATVVLAAMAWCYGLWSAGWPMRIRGSAMSLTVFVSLILLASFELYSGYPATAVEAAKVSFMELYQPPN